MQITRAIVPAAGRGTRLYPITKAQPKEMLPLGTRPTIQAVAEELTAAGISEILFIIGEGKSAIEDHFDPEAGVLEGEPPLFNHDRVQFFFTRQGAPRGLGHAVQCGERFAAERHVVVALGDCTIQSPEAAAPLRRMLEAHMRHGAAASIVVQQVSAEDTRRYGIVAPGRRLDENAIEISDIVEKPGPEAAPSRMAVAARYVFSPQLFCYLATSTPGHGGELQLTDAIRAMIADGHRVLAVPLRRDEHRLDVGNPASYARAFVRAMLADPQFGEGFARDTANILLRQDEHQAHNGSNDQRSCDPDLPEDSG